jgi:transglutaminase-like putative cysteine protease
LFVIDHITRYEYSLPVQLGVHVLRFLPPSLAGQRPGHCKLEITPGPSSRVESEDNWGNPIQRVGFQGETDHLEIRAHLEVHILETKPLLTTRRFRLPISYGSDTAALTSYLQPLEETTNLQSFVQPLLITAGDDGLAFLAALNQRIHGFYHRGVRVEGPPRTPAETLSLGEGVCRDLTVLFMAACRHVGIAARFVSGYQQGDGTRELRYLHAWPEVYLPGHGWLGYDPTHATQFGDDHVVVAAAPTAAEVTPVEGGYSFRGTAVTSTLATEIRITTF